MCLYRGMESQQRPEESVRNGYGRRIICNPVCPKVCGVGDPQTVVSERDQPEKNFSEEFLNDRSLCKMSHPLQFHICACLQEQSWFWNFRVEQSNQGGKSSAGVWSGFNRYGSESLQPSEEQLAEIREASWRLQGQKGTFHKATDAGTGRNIWDLSKCGWPTPTVWC